MKFPSHAKYLMRVRQTLLGRGERGIKFHDLNQLTRTKYLAQDDLRELLEEWKLREWVQSFLITGGRGRAPTIWRATTKLRDEYAHVTADGKIFIPSEDPSGEADEAQEQEAGPVVGDFRDAFRSRNAD